MVDEANTVFGLEDGLLDVSISISEDGMVNLHPAHRGFWLGDAALQARTTRRISLTAHVDSIVFAIPAGALQRHPAEWPADSMHFFRLSHANAAFAAHALAEALALPPHARFARLLLRLAPEDGLVRATQTEVGWLAGMNRAAFRRAFSNLITEGIVRIEYGKIRIVDRAALEAEALRR